MFALVENLNCVKVYRVSAYIKIYKWGRQVSNSEHVNDNAGCVERAVVCWNDSQNNRNWILEKIRYFDQLLSKYVLLTIYAYIYKQASRLAGCWMICNCRRMKIDKTGTACQFDYSTASAFSNEKLIPLDLKSKGKAHTHTSRPVVASSGEATCRCGKMDACRWCQQTSVTTLLTVGPV
ncbi:hypothetical protein T10_10781 [Trichinella papuae]|uniref:Uncharacterized protein n=1 Tax=Trichinella papuae TaxID=268474 RepID=A0A0V1MXW3_9BILA|nr:hypothetical protein T10_10781 [Trichinella papuae]